MLAPLARKGWAGEDEYVHRQPSALQGLVSKCKLANGPR